MSRREGLPGVPTSATDIIILAERFTGREMSSHPFALRVAEKAIGEQRQRVLPQTPKGKTLVETIREHPEVINKTHEAAILALASGDITGALEGANHLLAYTTTSLQHKLDTNALQYALEIHRDLAQKMRQEYSQTSDFLSSTYSVGVIADIEEARLNQKPLEELEHLRTLIHTVVLDGVLGDEALSYFDPSAYLVKIG